VERVRKKSFWVMALLGPVFFAAIFLLPLLMSTGGGVKRLVVVDRTTTTLGALVAARLDSSQRFFVVGRVPGGPGVEDSLAREVGVKRIDGFLVLSDALTASGHAEYRASNVSSLEDVGLLRETLGPWRSARGWSAPAWIRPWWLALRSACRSIPRRSPVGGRPRKAPASRSRSRIS